MVSKPRSRLFPFLPGVLACLSLGFSGVSQPANPSQGPPPRVEIIPRPAPPAPGAADTIRSNIRVDSTLVLIPVTVTDPMNRFVTGLEKEHFKVQEDNVEQTISHFASEDLRCCKSGPRHRQTDDSNFGGPAAAASDAWRGHSRQRGPSRAWPSIFQSGAFSRGPV